MISEGSMTFIASLKDVSIFALQFLVFTFIYLSSSINANAAQLNQPVLVVLVEFNDTKHLYSANSFDKLVFSNTSTSKSVTNFYNKISYGNFAIARADDDYPFTNNNDGMIGWITLSQNHPNCMGLSNMSCYQNLVASSLQALDPYVDLSKFDNNNDEVISKDELSIIFVVAGYELAAHDDEVNPSITGPFVYAHQYVLNAPVVLDGKQISNYALFGERHEYHQATIGIIAHELGHLMLGLPDLYDTTKRSQGAGPFDFMSSGSWGQSISDLYQGETPVHPSAWTSARANFIVSNSILSDQANIQLPAVANPASSVLRVNTSNPYEYFMVENRQLINYDAGLQKSINIANSNGGIAIWHIDETKSNNNNSSNKLVDLEEADGVQDLDGVSVAAKLIDLFFKDNNSIFNGSSNPNSKLYNGQSSNIAVVNISSPANVMSLDIIKNIGSAPQIGFSPASLSFQHDYSKTSVPSQTISISNTGGGALNWNATSNASWITLTPASGVGNGSINVSINLTGLTIGDYTGNISISAPGASNSPVNIPVTLSINYSMPIDSWQIVKPYNLDNNHLISIAYGNNSFVTVGANGTVMTSINGIDWTNRSSGTTYYLNGVAFGNNVFAAGSTYGGILTSSNNGATWTSRGYGDTYGFNSIAFGNNTFVAVGTTHDVNGPGVILTSADNGTTWTVRSPSGAYEFFSIVYGNNTFIAADIYDNIYISHDNGATWNPHTFSDIWPNAMTFGNNTFMTFNDYYWWIYTSSDNGSSWVPKSYLDFESGGLTYANNTFVAAGCLASMGYQGVIYSSDDNGVNWIQRNHDPNSYCYSDVVFGNNTFVAVGVGGIIVKSEQGNPAISFDLKSLEFGSVPSGASSTPQTITISNSGYSSLNITRLQIEGANALDFAILNDTCTNPPNPSVAPSGMCTLQIRFNPVAGGSKNAQLSITSNDSVNPTVYIPLSGIGLYALNVNVSTAGSGTVVSAPSGINCGSSCSSHFALNSTVGLYATPAQSYIFTGWSGACSGNEKCTVTMNSENNVTATFMPESSAVVRINDISPSYFTTLTDAYNSAVTGNIIEAMTYDFFEELYVNKEIEVLLKGGFDSDYTIDNGLSVIHSSLRITNGKLTVKNIVIR